jgi:hypothetical protein
LALAFKLMSAAQGKWRKRDGRNRLPEIIQGVAFRDGLRQLQNAARSNVTNFRRYLRAGALGRISDAPRLSAAGT